MSFRSGSESIGRAEAVLLITNPVTDGDSPPGSAPVPVSHPLGPLVRTYLSTTPVRTRIRAAFVLMAAGAIIGLAAGLRPDPSGLGTHRQLGLAGCPLPMLTGYPCPSCGMTTAFAFAVRGRLLSAFVAQPVGLCLAMATTVVALMAGYTLASGRSWQVNWYRINPDRLAFGVVGVILGAWGFKVVFGWITGRIPLP